MDLKRLLKFIISGPKKLEILKLKQPTMDNNNSKKQLDRYSMMIVSKYFKSLDDFNKMIQICKKYQEIPEMFHYNPVPSTKKTNFFPTIETYHIYDKDEKKIKGYDKYVYWNEVNFETYLNKKENEEFKNVKFTSNDWNKYKSFKGANILIKCSLSQCDSTEIDLTGITKIESYCFNGNKIVGHIGLDKRIAIIPDDCFSSCASLIELDLSYVKILGNYCFNYCESLTALTLPEMLYKIGESCFCGLSELEKIETKGIKLLETNMNYSLYKSFKTNGIDVKGVISYGSYDRNKYGNEIPEEVSIIKFYCFDNVTAIGDVILPKSVTKTESYCFNHCSIKSIDLSNVIENYCYFEECNELTSITLNKNIITPTGKSYYYFFNYLTALKNIDLSDTNHIPVVSNHLRKLMEEKGYQYGKCIYTQQDRIETNSIIPDEVNVIDTFVLNSESHVKTIVIPSNVTQICDYNIYSMSNLENIEIQSTNLQCNLGCFCYLPKIKELDLRSISSFGTYCICDCPCLTKLIIRNISIENGLNNCDSLKEIEIIGMGNNGQSINTTLESLIKNKGIHYSFSSK